MERAGTYWLSFDGQTVGPLSFEQASQLVDQQAGRAIQVWSDGWPSWRPVGEVWNGRMPDVVRPGSDAGLFVLDDRGQQHGPYTASTLRSGLAEGWLRPNNRVWTGDVWTTAAALLETPSAASPFRPIGHPGQQGYPPGSALDVARGMEIARGREAGRQLELQKQSISVKVITVFAVGLLVLFLKICHEAGR